MDSSTSTNWSSALQTILSRGLDFAVARENNRLLVNDPTPSVTGPNGQRVAVGQSALTAPGIAGIPVWGLVVGGAVLVLAVVLVARKL